MMRLIVLASIPLLVLGLSGCTDEPSAQTQPVSIETSQAAQSSENQGGNEEKPETDLEKLARLEQKMQSSKSQQEFVSHMQEILKFARGLAKKAKTDEEKLTAQTKALQAVAGLSSSGEDMSGSLKSADIWMGFILKHAQEDNVKIDARFFNVIAHLGSWLDESKSKEFELLLSKADAFAKIAKDDRRVGVTYFQIGLTAEQNGLKEIAQKAYKATKAKDPNMAKMAEGRIRRMNLIGNQMEIVGPTLDGKQFDLKSTKGKVVLVDFWATWCGPCISEIPTVKKVYEAYHEKGFEVVAISLDHEKEELVNYVKEHELPWTQIYIESDDETAMNPIVERYSIDAIPATFLIDRAGNVVKTDLRGDDLEPAVKKLIEQKE